MRWIALVFCTTITIFEVVHAQAPALPRQRAGVARADAATALPVRRVVLYKNGIGYFEHLGKVRDNQTISVDFNSSQLDDALKSLTALDLGNGRVTGISYNSDAPFSQRLNGLRLPVGERTNLSELLAALRSARLTVRTGDRVVTGRLLGVERRTAGSGPSQTTRDQMTLVGDGGAIRTVDLTPSVSIQLAERESAEQVGSALEDRFNVSSLTDDRVTLLVRDSGDNEAIKQALQPILAKKASIAALNGQVAGREQEIQRLHEEEQRVRENLQALRNTSEEKRLVKRYADQLSKAEDRIEAIQRERGDLDRALVQAQMELLRMIEELSVSVEAAARD